MLTPKDIETKKFSRAKAGGYHPEEVERFLDDVLDSFNAVIAEKDHLANKVEMLGEKLKKETDAKRELEKALADPQHIYNETLAAANAKADKIVIEAQNYAKKLIEAAHVEAERQQEVSNRFVTEVEEFKSKLLSIYESHVKLISSIPVMKIDEASTESATLEMLENSTVDASAEELKAEEPKVEEKAEEVEKAEEPKEDPDDDFDFSGVIEEEPAPAKDYVPSRYVAEELEKKPEPSIEEKKENRRPARSMYVEKDEEPEIDGLFDTEEEKPKKAKKRGFNFFGFVKDSEPDDDDDFDDDFDDDDYFDDYDDEE